MDENKRNLGSVHLKFSVSNKEGVKKELEKLERVRKKTRT